MFDAFAEKGKKSKLKNLILFMNLNYGETNKLIQLVQLKELCCSFKDAKCIDLLASLPELEALYVMLGMGEGTNKYS